MTTEEKSNELVVINNNFKPLVAFYTEKGLDPLVAQVKEKIAAEEFDISTKEGRTKMRSFAKFKIGGSKAFLQKMSDALREEGRLKDIAIRNETKRMADEIDALRDEWLRPLIEFENKEKERIQQHENEIFALENIHLFEFPDPTSELIEERIPALEVLFTRREWEEFSGRAERAYTKGKTVLKEMLSARIERDTQAAELKRLQEEEVERKAQAERDRIAKEAADKARIEAEQKAAREKAEAEAKAKAERERIQAEKDEADRRAHEAKAAQEAAEKKAEQDRVDAIEREKQAKEKAEADRVAAEQKAQADKEAAIQAERKRQADEAAAKKAEDDRRAADQAHRGKINSEVLADLQKIIDEGINGEDPMKDLVKAMATGKIRHVKINY